MNFKEFHRFTQTLTKETENSKKHPINQLRKLDLFYGINNFDNFNELN